MGGAATNKTMKKTHLILLPALIQPGFARTSWLPKAFISLPSDSLLVTVSPSPPLVAMNSKSASGRKKNHAPPNKGGGFGYKSPSSDASKDDGDSDIVYPDLELNVIKTLVPATIEGTTVGGVLSEEMYDRLEDIYGFDTFNFGGVGAIYKSISSGGSSTQGVGDILSPSLLPSIENDATSQNQSCSSRFDLNSMSPFEKFCVLHVDPLILTVEDFFTMNECDKYVQMSIDSERNHQEQNNNIQPMLLGQSQTIGKDSRSKAQRTSTTWFHYYEGVPELMAKASRLLGLEGIGRWEEPQTVRYRRNEKFTWHLDALSPEDVSSTVGAGQRVATLLVYLTDLPTKDGGATMFRDLGGDDGPLKM